MNSLNGIIISSVVTFVVLIATYIIQFYSKISPCNIEFDGSNKKEMKIMREYNELFDMIFYISGSVIMIFASVVIFALNDWFVALLMVELLYFIANIICMIVMYVRSVLYFNLKEINNKCMKIKNTPYDRYMA